MNLKEASELIHNRQSVFPAQYTGEELDKNLIDQFLANAHRAPTHRFTQPWRFHVFAGEQKKAVFDEAIRNYKNLNAANINPAKIDKMEEMKNQVSHMIFIVMHRDPEERVPEFEEVAAVSCAVQNIYLSLSAVPDAGGYWSTGAQFLAEDMHAYMKCKENEHIMGVFFIGKVGERPPLSKRNPLENHVVWH